MELHSFFPCVMIYHTVFHKKKSAYALSFVFQRQQSFYEEQDAERIG